MLKGHGGNIYDLAQRLGCDPFDIVDMSSNVNPLGPPSGLVGFLKEKLKTIVALPEVDAKSTAQGFADHYRLDAAQVIAGNGTTQFIYTLPPALETKQALIMGPTYADYADACEMHNVSYDYLMSAESLTFQPDIDAVIQHIKDYDTVFICNPNNPTGTLIPTADLERLCRSHPDTFFVIDESYLPFVNEADQFTMLHCDLPNVLVLNSMSKIFRIPGLRVGFLISSRQTIEKFRPFLLPWSVNSLAQAAVDYLMQHRIEVDEFIEKAVLFLETERKLMAQTFQDIPGITLFPSKTSYMLARLHGKITADILCDHLADNGILIRNCSNFTGLSEHFIRISLKTPEINSMLADKIKDFLNNA